MTLFIRAVLMCLAVAALFGGDAAMAADALREGVDLYKQQRFDDAVKVFETSISANPNNAAAHYYLANCYLALGKLEEADKSYQICLKFNPPADIAAYAKKMHEQLQKRIASGGATADEPGPPPTAAPMSSDRKQFDEEIIQLKLRNHKKLIDEANAKITTLLYQIDQLKKGLSEELQDDPLYFFRRGRQVTNASAQASQMQIQAKINSLEQQIVMIKDGVRREIEKMDAQTDNTIAELESQARGNSGNIKPILNSRSIYVRDYVHFTGDEPPPEFIVTPLKLTPGKYMGGGTGTGTPAKKP